MLKNIDPLLSGELLKSLQDMGHGDVIAIVDRNYPAVSTSKRVVALPGADITATTKAILSLLPVDTFVEPAVFRMGQVGNEAEPLEVHDDIQRVVDEAEGREVEIAVLERFEFYRRASEAFVTVATTEDRPYACFLITKGVV